MIRYNIIIILIFLVISCKNTKIAREIIQLPDGRTETVIYHTYGDSLKTGLYSNGKIYYRGELFPGFEGYRELETRYYDTDGDIFKYAYFLNDSLRYYRFYNKDGSTKESGGTGLIYLDDETTYVDTITTKEKFFQQLRVVHPPFTVSRIFFGDDVLDEQNRDFSLEPLSKLPIKGNLSGFLVDFNRNGTYTKVVYWSIQDTIGGSIQKGRIWRKFIVKDK